MTAQRMKVAVTDRQGLDRDGVQALGVVRAGDRVVMEGDAVDEDVADGRRARTFEAVMNEYVFCEGP